MANGPGPIPSLMDYETRESQTHPRLSVVTTVFNGERSLLRTIDSVRAQHIPDLEYIVIDAGSRDRTLDIIRANADIISFWKSEPDRGISDGFNKGIAFSRGEYVTLLNADDWLSPRQLAFGMETLDQTEADFVFGDLLYHDADGTVLHRIAGEASYAARIAHVMPGLNHPTVIMRRDVYTRFGLFDLSLRYAMDYELLLRLHRTGCKGVYDPRITGHMSLAGASDAFSSRALAEVRDISIRHGSAAASAWVRYGLRLARGHLRRVMERLMPSRAMLRLRRLTNKNIAGAG